MSNFKCPECGTDCIDSTNGYITGCEHFPADAQPAPDEKLSVKEALLMLQEEKNEN